jgi:hypothetical protein
MLVIHVYLCCSGPKQACHNFSLFCNFPITNSTFILHTHTHTHTHTQKLTFGIRQKSMITHQINWFTIYLFGVTSVAVGMWKLYVSCSSYICLDGGMTSVLTGGWSVISQAYNLKMACYRNVSQMHTLNVYRVKVTNWFRIWDHTVLLILNTSILQWRVSQPIGHDWYWVSKLIQVVCETNSWIYLLLTHTTLISVWKALFFVSVITCTNIVAMLVWPSCYKKIDTQMVPTKVASPTGKT